jgi:hypothetical protein
MYHQFLAIKGHQKHSFKWPVDAWICKCMNATDNLYEAYPHEMVWINSSLSVNNDIFPTIPPTLSAHRLWIFWYCVILEARIEQFLLEAEKIWQDLQVFSMTIFSIIQGHFSNKNTHFPTIKKFFICHKIAEPRAQDTRADMQNKKLTCSFFP